MNSEAPGHFQLHEGDTAQQAQRAIVRVFQNAGIDSADVDTRFLLQGHLGLEAAQLLADSKRRLGPHAGRLTAAVKRRLQGEPVSRILGLRWFYGRAFAISPDVLDPRPDTETIVETALAMAANEGWRDREICIADIGTGSGALIVTLLAELPLARGYATDVSPAALRIAAANAVRRGVAERVTFVHARNLGPITKQFDLIVANPPYIPTSEIPCLPAEVREFDPHLALDGGPDGLAIYREIFNEISCLTGSVVILFEVGAGQAGSVVKILRSRLIGLCETDITVVKDLGGHDRCVALRIHR